MGLLNKLTTGDGSTLSYNDGNTPFINPLSTKESQLHYDSITNQPGYSVNGNQFSFINSDFQQYEDGKNTPLPNPSQLDLLDPITVDPMNKPKYNSIPSQTYSSLYNTF